MQFNRLKIENVGNFFGAHEFKLRPSFNGQAKPIILFGGLNGAGKTTIFEAIRLCLYGQEMLGPVGQAKYHDYLKQKIHQSKSTALRPNSAAIELEFEYVSFGKVNVFEVERAWEWTGTRIKEVLTVHKNGLSLDDLERDSWQDFIKEMIPLGLSQLFFFDGEKIRRMMTDENSGELRRSIMSLLGLDLVERLQADLKIYRSKYLKETASSVLSQELAEIEAELEQTIDEITAIKTQKVEIDCLVADRQGHITEYRNKMAAQGEGYYKKRAELEERQRGLQKSIDTAKEKIRELAAGLLPVAIAASLAKSLEQQIKNEGAQRVNALVSDAVSQKWQEIMALVCSDQFLKSLEITKPTARKLRNEIARQVEQTLEGTKSASLEEEHFGFSERQALEVLGLLKKAQTELPKKLKSYTAGLEKDFKELERVVSLLDKAPDDRFILPMYETLDGLNAEISEHINRQNGLEQKLKALLLQKTELERRQKSLLSKLEGQAHLSEKFENANKVQRVLDRYRVELSRQKIARLQAEFSAIFKALHRKEDMIARVEIDPETCFVSLFDEHDLPIKKNSLSSGELEIYAISMLWALAKTSGQKLPFIIDTPLARLDTLHRDNLIQQFFPKASHQVMIFSTNTEVDRQYFDQLKPSLAKSYSLEYDNVAKMTTMKEGYFWS
jgi:DNA sulfur modification protein DndD